VRAFEEGDLQGGVRSFARAVFGAEAYRRLAGDLEEAMLANGRTLRAQLLGAGFPPLGPDDVRHITTPTLLVSGQQSPTLVRRLTLRLHPLLPDAQRVDIAGASHFMHHEQPPALNRAVLDFIARH
jgi:pimeloyl-ACP methyl ester carboxylesterase